MRISMKPLLAALALVIAVPVAAQAETPVHKTAAVAHHHHRAHHHKRLVHHNHKQVVPSLRHS